MKTILKRKSSNEQMTAQFVQKVFKDFLAEKKNFTLFLEGGLGAGKTFLTREILKAFGVAEAITSPTYTYVQEYKTSTQKFAHFDLYRLNSENFLEHGFTDIAEDSSICKIVEWPLNISEELRNVFSGDTFTIFIKHGIGASMRDLSFLQK